MAINANELRIGNYIYDGYNELTKVQSIVDGAINYELDYGNLWTNKECYFENINPIHITKKWIKKLGLYEIDNNIWRFNNYVIEHWNNMYVIKYISMKNEFILIGKEIKYVHELQNACFILTGSELTWQ